MRSSDSVLLIDCQAPKHSCNDKVVQGDPRKYKTFAETYPESLEVEGINYDQWFFYCFENISNRMVSGMVRFKNNIWNTF